MPPCAMLSRPPWPLRRRSAPARCSPGAGRSRAGSTLLRPPARAVETATVGGTVVEVDRDGHFVLADAEGGTLRVHAERLRLDGLARARQITVTGRLDDDELEAGHAIREDGSVVVRGAEEEDEEDLRDCIPPASSGLRQAAYLPQPAEARRAEALYALPAANRLHIIIADFAYVAAGLGM